MVVSQLTGNRCGHVPSAPRFVIAAHPYADNWQADQRDNLGHNRKSAWFYDVTKKLNEFYFFPRMIPALGLIYKEIATRRHRSEARESDVALLSALVHHIELASINWQEGFCRVGMPTKDGFLYFDNDYWSKKTGLTLSRVKRSFRRLVAVGFVQRERRWVERDAGKFKGLACMTLINHVLFDALGVIDGLKEAGKYAYEKLAAAAKHLESSVGKMLSCAVTKLRKNKATASKTKLKATDFPDTDPRHWEQSLSDAQRSAFRHRYLQLVIEREGADPASIYREAHRAVVMA